MSVNCLNCKRGLSCGCQKRVASNGVSVCTSCIASYEASLGAKKPQINNSISNPTGVNVIYNGPGKVISKT